MIDYRNLQHTTSVTFYDTKGLHKKWNIDFKDKKHLIPSIVDLCELWKVPFDEIIDFAVREDIVSEFLEYSTYKCSCSELVFGRGLYKEIWERDSYRKVYYDVYVKEHTYIGLTFKKIITHIIKTYYPKFYLFDTEDFPVYEDTPICAIPSEYQRFTLKELYGWMKGQVEKIRYNIYSTIPTDIIFLPVKSVEFGNRQISISLYIPVKAIVENDFSLIEDCHVHTIIKPDAVVGRKEGNFFEGKQKDFPYWDEPVIQDFKKLFLE